MKQKMHTKHVLTEIIFVHGGLLAWSFRVLGAQSDRPGRESWVNKFETWGQSETQSRRRKIRQFGATAISESKAGKDVFAYMPTLV